MIVEWTGLLADATDPARGPGAGMDTLIFLIAPLALFVLFIVMPMRRDARVRKNMLGLLKKGDRVLINGFMIANVIQIIKPENQQGEDELLVKVDDNANIKLRVLRGSVTRILKSDESTAKEGA
jgi:preprotein translocase YajC subunit